MYDGSAIAMAELRFREDLWRTAPSDAVEEAGVEYARFGPLLATVFGELPETSVLNVVQGARMVGANKIIGVDLNPGRKALAEKFGMTHFVNPKEVEGDLVAHLVALTDGGADYSFECVGNVDLMRQALECCHRGWGVSVIIGVAGAGQEIKTRPFQLVTGRVWKGTAFGGARGRTDVPRIVDWYMDRKINIDELITHVMPLEKINDAFDLMHKGESIRSVVTF